MLPSAEEIRTIPSKPRPLPLESWVPAELSRLVQSIRKNVEASIVAGTLGLPQSAQSEPASAQNRS